MFSADSRFAPDSRGSPRDDACRTRAIAAGGGARVGDGFGTVRVCECIARRVTLWTRLWYQLF